MGRRKYVAPTELLIFLWVGFYKYAAPLALGKAAVTRIAPIFTNGISIRVNA
jgi:hypothetical protein